MYRWLKVKHILIQHPAEDTAYKGVLKNYFYLKKGFIVAALTGNWKFYCPPCVKILLATKSGVYANNSQT